MDLHSFNHGKGFVVTLGPEETLVVRAAGYMYTLNLKEERSKLGKLKEYEITMIPDPIEDHHGI